MEIKNSCQFLQPRSLAAFLQESSLPFSARGPAIFLCQIAFFIEICLLLQPICKFGVLEIMTRGCGEIGRRTRLRI